MGAHGNISRVAGSMRQVSKTLLRGDNPAKTL
jgi:hypothetical protein